VRVRRTANLAMCSFRYHISFGGAGIMPGSHAAPATHAAIHREINLNILLAQHLNNFFVLKAIISLSTEICT